MATGKAARLGTGVAGWLLLLGPGLAAAQSDEIQVYDGSLAPPGVFNLTWHNNYTIDGAATAAFPGGLVTRHSLNGVTEWALGVTDWFEAGLYLPLYSVGSGQGLQFDGFKGRALFAVPNAAQRRFFYGINFELSYNRPQWDEKRYTSEIRPIVGWHLGDIDVVLNPILDNSFEGVSKLDFAPETRLAYNFSPRWAAAVEEYDDFGPLRDLYPSAEQSHQLFGVFDFSGGALSVEGGLGFGLNSATDDLIVKLIVSTDLGRLRR